MTDWVRVRHADNPRLEYTVTRRKAEKDPRLTILNRPAVDVNGTPLDAVARTPKAPPLNPTTVKEVTK